MTYPREWPGNWDRVNLLINLTLIDIVSGRQPVFNKLALSIKLYGIS